MNYLKIHFYSKTDGSFKGHGILVKSDDSFYVITKKTGDPMIPYITCGQQIAVGDTQITATGGVKKSIAIGATCISAQIVPRIKNMKSII